MREFETIRGFPVTCVGAKRETHTDTVTHQRAHRQITRFPQNFSEYEPQIVRFKVKKNVERFYSFAYIS